MRIGQNKFKGKNGNFFEIFNFKVLEQENVYFFFFFKY